MQDPCPVVEVGGRMYNVEVFYLEHILKLIKENDRARVSVSYVFYINFMLRQVLLKTCICIQEAAGRLLMDSFDIDAPAIYELSEPSVYTVTYYLCNILNTACQQGKITLQSNNFSVHAFLPPFLCTYLYSSHACMQI
jgi:hypothetical protein